MKVYVSSPMDAQEDLTDLLQKFKEYKIDFYVPLPVDSTKHEYVFTDIEFVKQSDVLLLYLPHVSLGASAELGMFKAFNPHKPIICYKCIEHGWLEILCNYKTSNVDETFEIMESLNNLFKFRLNFL